MNQKNNSAKMIDPTKKTILPFVVHRAPLENHIAYEKKGHWTQKEKLKYVIFLSYFKEKFTSKDKKKRFCRIFKVMSDFIKTRTHNQCRSHHQKMEKQRFQVDSIIKNVVSKYHPRVYQELYERYLIQIENLSVDDHQEYKIRKINQNQLKYSSQSNLELPKNQERKNLNQKIKQNIQFKRVENIPPTFKTKQQNDAQLVFQKPYYNKRELKLTEQCEEEEIDFQITAKNLNFQFPPQNSLFLENQKSLDFAYNNNCFGLKFNSERQVPISFTDYLQNLEMRKLDCLNKATFHYNQMQMELSNVAECEKEKSTLIEQQTTIIKQQKQFNYGYSNFLWGFPDSHKSC